MKKSGQELSKGDKLLIVIYEMSSGKNLAFLKSEDVFVQAFRKFPNDFHLRGYPEYPDSGDAPQRRLYALKQYGLVQIRNKFINLTEKGVELAQTLMLGHGPSDTKPIHKLTRDVKNEIERITGTDAYQLFIKDNVNQILDTDFFAYLGTTVRSERTDFIARVKTVQEAIQIIKSDETYKIMVDLHAYLMDRFKNIIVVKLSTNYPRRQHE